ncbi:hypothetical protein NPIL_263241 [Nephila pilipes]|uniref:Arm DNA-binding domain-containing protein n=1 Tax=Nephila pilipes TaxID=299642 RepID=A0A8X6UHF5_NEPPI|nr:hypothetical protein NPIL_263241 [Nephila pilipes]
MTRYPLWVRLTHIKTRNRALINRTINRDWKEFYCKISAREDNSFDLNRIITQKTTTFHCSVAELQINCSDFEKAGNFQDSLESTFQENWLSISDEKIEEGKESSDFIENDPLSPNSAPGH